MVDEMTRATAQVNHLLTEMVDIGRFRSVLFLTDADSDPQVSEAFRRVFAQRGVQPVYIAFRTAEWSHQEPPPSVAAAMQESDMMVHHLRMSITHAPSTRTALLSRGSRLMLCKGSVLSDLLSGAISVDYRALQQRGARVAATVIDGAPLECTAPNGTAFSCRVRIQGQAFVEDGNLERPGSIAVLPSGIVAWSQTGASGRLVFDALDSWGRLEPALAFDVEDGYVVRSDGDPGGRAKLEDVFALDREARYLGEIGVGINEGARWRLGEVNGEAKRSAGLVHVGLGNSIPFGGSVRSDFHIDGLIPDATIRIGGRTLVERGRLAV